MAGVVALGKQLRNLGQPAHAVTVLDVSRMQLIGSDAQVEMTASDVLILSALARAPGQKLERWQIAEIVGGNDSNDGDTPSAATLEMRITRLRKKLAAVGAPAPHIKSLHKVGYALCTPVVLQ